jgi:hypothetical protein
MRENLTDLPGSWSEAGGPDDRALSGESRVGSAL